MQIIVALKQSIICQNALGYSCVDIMYYFCKGVFWMIFFYTISTFFEVVDEVEEIIYFNQDVWYDNKRYGVFMKLTNLTYNNSSTKHSKAELDYFYKGKPMKLYEIMAGLTNFMELSWYFSFSTTKWVTYVKLWETGSLPAGVINFCSLCFDVGMFCIEDQLSSSLAQDTVTIL